MVQSIKPRNYGVIVRTVAEGKKVPVLDAELKELVNKWEEAFLNIKKRIKITKTFYRGDEQDNHYSPRYA